MKLFTVGPVLMYPETLDVASKQLPYFRTDEFSKIMLETAERLKRIIGTSQNSEAIFITGSGTASMEAVVSNAFDSSDRVLIIDGGSFGHRFKQLCDIYQIPNDTISLSFGETLTQEHFDSIDGTRYTALLVNIHETSTGQLYDIHLLQNFCKQYHLFLVVDAISSFLSDPYQMDDLESIVRLLVPKKRYPFLQDFLWLS